MRRRFIVTDGALRVEREVTSGDERRRILADHFGLALDGTATHGLRRITPLCYKTRAPFALLERF